MPNAALPMLVTLPGIVTLVNLVAQNAPPPILTTLSGIVTPVRLVQPVNA